MSAPVISDHALLRFLERSGGIDLEALRAQLAQALHRSHAAARSIGEEHFRIKIGESVFVFRGDTCVTVLEPHMRWSGQGPAQ